MSDSARRRLSWVDRLQVECDSAIGALRSCWKRVERDATPGAVHDLRVATRQLTAMIALLDSVSAQRGPRRKVRRYSRKLRQSLGRIRDLDVALRLARRSGAQTVPKGFVVDLERLRERELRRWIEGWSRSRRKRLVRKIRGVLRLSTATLRIDEAMAAGRARQNLAEQIRLLETSGSSTRDPARQHAQRVLCRRIRFGADSAAAVFRGMRFEGSEARARFQKRAGLLRDRLLLRNFLEDWNSAAAR